MPLSAQSEVASDLWRVAAGTLVAPAPLLDGATSLLWNPVRSLSPDGPRIVAGVTSIHAPEEIGVNGGAVSVAARFGTATASMVWGRLGIDGIERTTTSPEAGGTLAIDAQVLALGLSRPVGEWFTAGAAVRIATGTLGDATETRAGLDLGALATFDHLRLGAVARAFDPSSDNGHSAIYQVAAEARSSAFPALGTTGVFRVRYGSTIQYGEDVAALITAGFSLGAAVQVDAGAAREHIAAHTVWRSRVGITAGTEQYRVEFGRDGGVNGFGATYAFGLSAGW